jgi:hypothetical protein
MTTSISSRIAVFSMAALTFALLTAGSLTQSVFAPSEPNAKARAIQAGVSLDSETAGTLGVDIDCVGGILSSANADSIICYLVPEGVPTPNYKTDASVVSQAGASSSCPSDAGFTASDECFSTTFSSALFTPGDWRFVVEFYSNGQLVGLAGIDYRVHTFFVIPESPIGAAALVLSSLAALGGFMYLRSHKHESLAPFAHP